MRRQYLRPKRICFTIVPTRTGFTDQLIQFSAFYKLGVSLGYTYVHTPFESLRSTDVRATTFGQIAHLLIGLFWLNPKQDVYHFLGFNRYFNSKNPKIISRKTGVVCIRLTDRLLKRKNIVSFEELQGYIRTCVAGKADAKAEALLVRFRADFGWKFFSLIHANIPAFQDQLDLRSVYFETRKSDPRTSKFLPNKVNVLVHVRQGDAGAVETPWGTIIPVDERRRGRGWLTEHNKVEDIGPLLQPIDYYRFAKRLLSYFDEDTLSVLCFSDGYQRAFRIIEHHTRKLKLTSDRRQSLRRSRSSYDAKHFSIFRKLKNSSCFIGETQENLRDLIHSTLTADLVIAGSRPAMVPKLIAGYCSDDLPAAIILYRGTRPDYSDMRSDHEERFIYANVDNPHYESIVDGLAKSVDKWTFGPGSEKSVLG